MSGLFPMRWSFKLLFRHVERARHTHTHTYIHTNMLQVTCKEPYEWRQGTDAEWEFAPAVQAAAGRELFHVGICVFHTRARVCMCVCVRGKLAFLLIVPYNVVTFQL